MAQIIKKLVPNEMFELNLLQFSKDLIFKKEGNQRFIFDRGIRQKQFGFKQTLSCYNLKRIGR